MKCVVTGAAGQIAYSLLFRLAGIKELQPLELRLLDVPGMETALHGIQCELEDCAFPSIQRILTTTDPEIAFEGVDIALLVGAKPRAPGMERKDLLQDNAKIFQLQGQALNRVASPHVRVLVVGNPCNTNCLIARSWAKDLNGATFASMTQLDQLRAEAYLAKMGSCSLSDVSPVIVWGNHSTTQVIDASHIQKQFPQQFLERDVMPFVQKRGAQVLQIRGKSSAASAANAALVSLKNLLGLTAGHYSAGVFSKNNPYGIQQDLIFSFPCHTNEKGEVVISQDLPYEEWLEPYIRATEKELMEERDAVRHLLGQNI